jgi:hypothetical protein
VRRLTRARNRPPDCCVPPAVKTLLCVPLLALVAACGTGDTADTAGPGQPPTSAAGGSDAVPGEAVPYDAAAAPAFVTERPELPSCGRYGVGPRPLPQAVHDCFALALGGAEGAEYAVADVTIEGDVVVRYYRALPGSTGVEVLVDSTRDRFGAQTWTRDDCTGYDAARGVATGCSPDGTGEI